MDVDGYLSSYVDSLLGGDVIGGHVNGSNHLIIEKRDLSTTDAGLIVDTTSLEARMLAIENHISYLQIPAICMVRHGFAQSIPSGVWTSMLWDTEIVDNRGMHSPSVNNERIYAQETGLFQLTGAVGWAATSSTRRGVRWYKNGAAMGPWGMVNPSSVNGGQPTSRIGPFLGTANAGDYFHLAAYQDNAAAVNTQPLISWASVMRVSD